MSEQNRIYHELRDHPKAAQKAVEIARNMPGANETERLAAAQRACVDYVIREFGGNTRAFLEAYDARRVTAADLVVATGRDHLSLA